MRFLTPPAQNDLIVVLLTAANSILLIVTIFYSQLLCIGLICKAAPAISHGLYLPIMSLSSKYFFPEITFGSHPNQKRSTVSSSAVLHLAQPQRSLWPADQSTEELQGKFGFPCSVSKCVTLHSGVYQPGCTLEACLVGFFWSWLLNTDMRFQHDHT